MLFGCFRELEKLLIGDIKNERDVKMYLEGHYIQVDEQIQKLRVLKVLFVFITLGALFI